MDDDIIDTTPRGLRQAARKGTKLEQENRELRRELEMRKALGNDVVESPFGRMFSAACAETEVDAIRAAWKDYSDSAAQTFGFSAQGGTPDPVLSDHDLSSTRERQALANGAMPDSPPTLNGRRSAQQAHAQAIADGRGEDEALALGFHHLVKAAADGDGSLVLGRQGQR